MMSVYLPVAMLISNFPSRSVYAPFPVPSTRTFTPGKNSPVALSNIEPRIIPF
jgi:hypothetical protein